MPFKDTDKNKQYQKTWQREKAARTSKLAKTSGMSYRPLAQGIVTWDELQEKTYDKLKTYEECVELAKKNMMGRRTDRLAIAALATRACEIKHGGDRRSKSFKITADDKSLLSFARGIGISNKTLHAWTRIYHFIRFEIPKDAPINMTAAEIMIKNKGLMNDPVGNYTTLVDKGSVLRNSFHATRYITYACTQISKRGIGDWPKEEVDRLNKQVDILLKLLRKEGVRK